MVSICGSCTEEINERDFLVCHGACRETFHVKCVGLKASVCKMIADCANLHWYCNACNNSPMIDVASSLKEVKASIDNLAVKIDLKVSGPTTPTWPLNIRDFKRKREDFSPGAPNPKRAVVPNPSSDLISGTNESACLKVVEVRKNIVVSQLHPSTTAPELIAYLNAELKLDGTASDIRCVPLVPSGKVLTDLDFIGFKLSFPESLYCKIMLPALWPRGVTLRDFVFRKKNNNKNMGFYLPNRQAGGITPSTPVV